MVSRMRLLWQTAWRWVVMLLVMLVLLSVVTALAPRAFASTTCVSSADHVVGLYATNYDVTVTKMHRVQTKCYGPHHWLHSTRTHVWFVNTSWGQAFGVKVTVGPPIVVYSDPGVWRWRQDYSITSCFAYYSLFCGPTMSFKWHTDIYAPRLRGGFVWFSPICTNNACRAGTPDRLEFR